MSAGLYHIERGLHAQGLRLVAGIDEAGRGPLAGPVCAAAVVFEPGARIPGTQAGSAGAAVRRYAHERARGQATVGYHRATAATRERTETE